MYPYNTEVLVPTNVFILTVENWYWWSNSYADIYICYSKGWIKKCFRDISAHLSLSPFDAFNVSSDVIGDFFTTDQSTTTMTTTYKKKTIKLCSFWGWLSRQEVQANDSTSQELSWVRSPSVMKRLSFGKKLRRDQREQNMENTRKLKLYFLYLNDIVVKR